MSRCTQIISMRILPLKELKFLRLWPPLSQEPPGITPTCFCQKSMPRCSRSVTKTSPLLKWSSYKSLRRTLKSFTRRMNLSLNWLQSIYHSTMVRASILQLAKLRPLNTLNKRIPCSFRSMISTRIWIGKIKEAKLPNLALKLGSWMSTKWVHSARFATYLWSSVLSELSPSFSTTKWC